MVEFLNKLSIFEISPFFQEPVEKLTIKISYYRIANFSIKKINDSNYYFSIVGNTLEGIFNYNATVNTNSQQISKLCSYIYEFQQEILKE